MFRHFWSNKVFKWRFIHAITLKKSIFSKCKHPINLVTNKQWHNTIPPTHSHRKQPSGSKFHFISCFGEEHAGESIHAISSCAGGARLPWRQMQLGSNSILCSEHTWTEPARMRLLLQKHGGRRRRRDLRSQRLSVPAHNTGIWPRRPAAWEWAETGTPEGRRRGWRRWTWGKVWYLEHRTQKYVTLIRVPYFPENKS